MGFIIAQGPRNFGPSLGEFALFNQHRGHVTVSGGGLANGLPGQDCRARIVRDGDAEVIARNIGRAVQLEGGAELHGGLGFAALFEQAVTQVVMQIVLVLARGKCDVDGLAMSLFA
ncbi:MAG: hypothetical protein JWO80_255 [Bryobacterales bacterium]|nr:hypothetical protein [Bryobacterales bacterium]